MNALRIVLMILVAVTLVACAAGPDYRKPDVPAPAVFPAAFKEAWLPATPGGAAEPASWWQEFGDAQLDELESRALQFNQSLRVSEAQYRAAAAAVGGARAALFPTVGVAAASTRSSGSTGIRAQAGANGASPNATTANTVTQDRLTASLSWEVDLWGRLRRSLEQNRATAQASASDLAAAQLSVTAMLAQTYMQLRAVELQSALLKQTIVAYQRSLQITQNRYTAGVAASTDLTQAQSQLASAEAQLADLAVQRAPLAHAIATLTGRTPEDFSLAETAGLPIQPVVPTVLPATLLQRRPDVAAAERRMAAANAGIGIARSAYFPNLTLSGSGGYEQSGWHDLISLPNRIWSLGPELAATLFDGGARRAQTRVARANYDAAVATYRQSVLTAFAEADNALANLRGLAQEQAATERQSAAANETLRVTENQYRAGTVSYLNVAIAQSAALSAQSNLIGVRSRRLLAHIALLTAMGDSPASRSR